jgi:peptidoglycan lytic transglycosylase
MTKASNALAITTVVLGCALGATSAIAEETKPIQSGAASWYGPGFHGKRTANGERFNTNDLTAAHRTLPFGAKVRVTNERTGRSVVVRINDRGPYAHGRVIVSRRPPQRRSASRAWARSPSPRSKPDQTDRTRPLGDNVAGDFTVGAGRNIRPGFFVGQGCCARRLRHDGLELHDCAVLTALVVGPLNGDHGRNRAAFRSCRLCLRRPSRRR